jgi:hypothetical protein
MQPMSVRSFIRLSAMIVAATVLVAIPEEASPREPLLFGQDGLQEEGGGLQYTEDAYGNPNCGGRCGGRPCCKIIIYQS